MGRLRSFVGALVVGALVLVAGPLGVSAQDSARQARARQLYAEAQALFDSGQYAAAEASFRAAYEQVPNPVVLRAIAASQERQGNIALAVQTLEQYLREAPNASDRAQVEQRLRELNARGSVIAVSSTPPGAQIYVDGEATGQVTPADVQVAVGEHTIELRLEGYQPRAQTLNAAAGTRMRLEVPLQEGAAPEPEPDPGQPEVSDGGAPGDPSVGVWVSSGIAAAGLISGTVFGFLALSEQSNFDAMPTHQAADQGELFALIADISFGVAAAAAITAVVLYIVERGSGGGQAQQETATSGVRLDVAPWADANGGGMAAQLRF